MMKQLLYEINHCKIVYIDKNTKNQQQRDAILKSTYIFAVTSMFWRDIRVSKHLPDCPDFMASFWKKSDVKY